MSHVACDKLRESTPADAWEATSKRLLALGKFEIPDSPQGLYQLFLCACACGVVRVRWCVCVSCGGD
jgi:hypothetical protein